MAPSPDTDATTRDATLLLFRIVAAAVGLWLVVGLVVRPDSPITEVGRAERERSLVARGAKRLYATHHAAEAFDRDAACGERALIYVLGSSITREAIDTPALEQRLRDGGLDVCVRKYAIDRGAPFFTWSMLAAVDLRPGDRVITSVAFDNFTTDWLDTHKGLHPYLNYLPGPRHLWTLRELPVAQRLEYSLSAAPPHGLVHSLPSFREGLVAWFRYGTGTGPRPEPVPPMDHTGKDLIRGFRDQDRWEKTRIGLADLGLGAGQLHHDGLLAWHAEVRAAGAEPLTLFVPHSPEYIADYLADDLRPAFHDHMREAVPPYVVFGDLPQDHYTDYKHLDNDGRAVFTEALAGLLLAGGPLPTEVPLVPRPAAATQALTALRQASERRRRR